MTTETKNRIKTAVGQRMTDSGMSQNKLATSIGVSSATLSNLIADKWDMISADMWRGIASSIGFKNNEWQPAATTNYKLMHSLMRNSKNMSISNLVCDEAGYGKSFSCANYARSNRNVFYVECEEHFSRKVFLDKLMKSMGLASEAMKASDQIEVVCAHLKTLERPLVIIHHNSRPKDSTMMIFIAMYNALEGYCGFMVCGTKALGMYIEKNARRNKLGFKELYSRLGRNVITLEQPNRRDVSLICQANGITDELTITEIFNRSDFDLRRVRLDVLTVAAQSESAAA